MKEERYDSNNKLTCVDTNDIFSCVTIYKTTSHLLNILNL